MLLSKPINIGLLLCDNISVEDQENYGSYHQICQNSLDETETTIKLIPIRCFEGEPLPDPNDFQGYIITGSRFSVYEDLPWLPPLFDFVRTCWERKIKMVGICFGHQLLAYALGGKVEKANVGWGFGIHTVHITQKQTWMSDAHKLKGDSYNIVVIHQDQVTQIPPEFRTIAQSDFCPNSMMVADGKILGIQGHPEFDKTFCQFRAEAKKDIIGEQVYQSALDSLRENELDSSVIRQWVNNFLVK